VRLSRSELWHDPRRVQWQLSRVPQAGTPGILTTFRVLYQLEDDEISVVGSGTERSSEVVVQLVGFFVLRHR